MVEEQAKPKFVLPASLAEPADIMRASRELESVDDFLRESAIRKSPAATALPKTTKALRELAEVNGLNLLQPDHRAKADRLLDALQKAAPVLHISFAVDPSSTFVENIITRLRQSIHPYLLVQIGLQPSIAGGCIVRSENKLFDFSLRQHLRKHKDLLTKIIANLDEENAPEPSAAPAASTVSAPPAQPAADATAATAPATGLAEPLSPTPVLPQETAA